MDAWGLVLYDGLWCFWSWSKSYRKVIWDNYMSRSFTRKVIEKISKSVRAYIYLVLTSQVQAR